RAHRAELPRRGGVRLRPGGRGAPGRGGRGGGVAARGAGGGPADAHRHRRAAARAGARALPRLDRAGRGSGPIADQPVRTRRPPPPFRPARVARTERLTPRMVRVTLAGPALRGLTIDAPAASVRVLLPEPGAS